MKKDMDDIDYVLAKYKIKKANNIDATQEELIIVNSAFSMIPFSEEEIKKKRTKIVTHPLVKCRETFPIYKKALNHLTEKFKIYKEYDTTCHKNGSGNEIYEDLVDAYKKFDNIISDFFEDLIDYGDFIDAVLIPKLEEEFMWELEVLEKKSVIECFQYSIDLIHTTTPFLEEALADGNKGMCMTLAPYIDGCSMNMMWKIMLEEDKSRI